MAETNAAVADDTDVPTQSRVDFADEDAALAAENAGLDLGEASRRRPQAGTRPAATWRASRRRSCWRFSPGCSKSARCSPCAGMWRPSR